LYVHEFGFWAPSTSADDTETRWHFLLQRSINRQSSQAKPNSAPVNSLVFKLICGINIHIYFCMHYTRSYIAKQQMYKMYRTLPYIRVFFYKPCAHSISLFAISLFFATVLTNKKKSCGAVITPPPLNPSRCQFLKREKSYSVTFGVSIWRPCPDFLEINQGNFEPGFFWKMQKVMFFYKKKSWQISATVDYIYVNPRFLTKSLDLKVPKCENFHRTDFFDFFTIKPLRVGDFRAKIKNSKF